MMAVAAPNGGWQEELKDKVGSEVAANIETEGAAAVATMTSSGTPSSSSPPPPPPLHSPTSPTDNGDGNGNGQASTYVVDPTNFPATSDGAAAFLAEIDGPRPIPEGSPPDNAVASFRASDVLVAAGATREIPIPVWTADSTVTVVRIGVDDEHCEGFDIGFSVYLTTAAAGGSTSTSTSTSTAAGRSGVSNVTIVREPERIATIGSNAKPALSFKVDNVPSTVLLKFDNAYSWITNKRVLYHVEVRPPIDEFVVARSRRAELAIDSVAMSLRQARDGVSKIRQVRQSVEQKARKTREITEATQKALGDNVVAFKNAVKAVKQVENSMNEKELETEENKRLVQQMDQEKQQIEAYIQKLRKELLVAESELEQKVEQIKIQHSNIETNIDESNAIEADIDDRLNAIEVAGDEIKEMEASVKVVEDESAEAARELEIITEEENKATAHMKFHDKLFQALQLRLLEKPQEV